jgi:Fe-S cluster biogenesis protein NfuA
MDTDTETGPADAELAARIETFLRRNFPQIAMHGGSAGVEAVDEAAGEVWLALGGACSGCGISPMTVQALESRLLVEFPELTHVHTSTGGAGGYDDRHPDADRGPDLRDVPF